MTHTPAAASFSKFIHGRIIIVNLLDLSAVPFVNNAWLLSTQQKQVSLTAQCFKRPGLPA